MEAFAYSKVELSGSTYGILLERILVSKHVGWQRLKKGAREGDITTQHGRHLEVKVSLGGSTIGRADTFNFRSIRLNCTCDFFLFIAYYVNEKNYGSLGELFVFKLTKIELLPFLPKSFNHGTKEL